MLAKPTQSEIRKMIKSNNMTVESFAKLIFETPQTVNLWLEKTSEKWRVVMPSTTWELAKIIMNHKDAIPCFKNQCVVIK